MSLFRKPTKKIQRRQFAADDDEDGDPEPPPPPVISRKKENKPAKTKTLLSFADEEEEEEEFKVKKSSQSKRLAKKRDKEKRKAEDDVKVENGHEDTAMATVNEPTKAKKKVTLEGLILSGRAALAADGTGDVSDEDGDNQEPDEDEGRGFHRYRAETVRAALASGFGDAIPDAALIHAARKTRQQARELGGGDFIPVNEGTKKGSRLVREDSGDEEDGRIHVRGIDLPSDKPKRSAEAAESDAENDSEGERWAAQQLMQAGAADVAAELEMNPFAMAPPPPRLDEAPAHLRPLAPVPPATAQDLVNALRNRLQDLLVARDDTTAKHAELEQRLLAAATKRETAAARCSALDAAYRRAQAARGYCTDLMECLDEKMPELEALERRAVDLHRHRCELLQERRRADTRDQAQDVLALAARPGTTRPPDPEDKIRRTAEREGRRRARRLQREASGVSHTDGDSSDDDLPPPMALKHKHEAEEIRRLSASLFAEARPAFRSVRGVCASLARLRRRAPSLYADAYIADCLPKLLAPFVRHQLILWNPLADQDNEDFEKMDWYKVLMMYGVRREVLSDDSDFSDDSDDGSRPMISEDSTKEDADLFLVPTVVSRVLVPKLTELVEVAWDPMCVRACVRLRGLLLRLASMPLRAAPLRSLAASAAVRLKAALAADVFLPPLPPQIMDGVGGAFWRRCLGAGVRLLRCVLALCAPPPTLHAENIALALIGTLCTAAGAAPAQSAASAASLLAASLPRAHCPLRTAALKRVAALAQRAYGGLERDNPLHLKALEQARSVIAEAKAAEQT